MISYTYEIDRSFEMHVIISPNRTNCEKLIEMYAMYEDTCRQYIFEIRGYIDERQTATIIDQAVPAGSYQLSYSEPRELSLVRQRF